MIAADSTLPTTSPAQTTPRTAPNQRDAAHQTAPPAAEAAGAEPASFARLITMLRTPTLPGGDASASARSAAPRAKPKPRAAQAVGTHEPILAQAALNPTKLAEQELRSPTDKQTTPGAETLQSTPRNKAGEEQAPAPHARPKALAPSAAEVAAPGAQSHQEHAQRDGAGTQGQPAADQQQATLRAHARTASVGGVTAVDHAGTAASGNAGTQPRGGSAPQPASVTAASGAARAGKAQAFINKLSQAAAPARAQVQKQHVTDAATRALGIAVKKGGGEATIRLRPEGLGQLKVHIKMDDAKVHATLTAQTASARDLLNDSLPHLRSALEAQGLTVEHILVEPAGAPAAAQDAQHAARTEAHAATPDGSGNPHQSQEQRSALADHTPGGDRTSPSTDAHDNQEPLWAITPGTTSTAPGAMEWVA